MGDPTADFILSGEEKKKPFVFVFNGKQSMSSLFACVDLLMATEYLIDFSINALDAIRLQNHYNERNRRIQLNESAENEKNLCSIVTSLKYDLSLNLHRILRACKRTKVVHRRLLCLKMPSFFSFRCPRQIFSCYEQLERIQRIIHFY